MYFPMYFQKITRHLCSVVVLLFLKLRIMSQLYEDRYGIRKSLLTYKNQRFKNIHHPPKSTELMNTYTEKSVLLKSVLAPTPYVTKLFNIPKCKYRRRMFYNRKMHWESFWFCMPAPFFIDRIYG